MTKTNYAFDGWYQEDSFTNKWYFALDTVDNDITLYAKWTVIPAGKYAVTFSAGGGYPSPDLEIVSSGEKITEPAAMTKTGYAFDGWYKEAGFTNKWDFAVDTVSTTITLYAKWIDQDQSGSFAGVWYTSGQTSSETHYVMRMTATDTTWLVEQNRGSGWSAVMKGSYTQSGDEVVGEMEYADIDIDNITTNWKAYEDLTDEEKGDSIPPSSTVSITTSNSGNSFSMEGVITFDREIYADRLANTTLTGIVDDRTAKVDLDDKKMWTMTVDYNDTMVNFLKGVYMMTGAATANTIITHIYDPEGGWALIDRFMPDDVKDQALPAEGQILTISDITGTGCKLIFDGASVTFTLNP